MPSSSTNNGIGTLSEHSLHAELKEAYSTQSDKIEADVDGYIADILRDSHIIEIQTKQLASLRDKVVNLLENYQVTIVHPISKTKWIVKESLNGSKILSRRKSPLRKNIYNIFEELVHVPFLLTHENLELEVVLINEEEIRRNDGKGSWRRKGWSIYDRRLLEILDTTKFSSPRDLLRLLPLELKTPFTNRDLAKILDIKMNIAQKMTYTLRKLGFLQVSGKKGRANLHVIA